MGTGAEQPFSIGLNAPIGDHREPARRGRIARRKNRKPGHEGRAFPITDQSPSMVHEQRQENDDRQGNAEQPKKSAST
jgi:hypothetical protein